jgi:hypothetical protein
VEREVLDPEAGVEVALGAACSRDESLEHATDVVVVVEAQAGRLEGAHAADPETTGGVDRDLFDTVVGEQWREGAERPHREYDESSCLLGEAGGDGSRS